MPLIYPEGKASATKASQWVFADKSGVWHVQVDRIDALVISEQSSQEKSYDVDTRQGPYCLFLFTLFVGSSSIAHLRAAEQTDSMPNFLFVIADDCIFRDIGCYRGQVLTPNIDSLVW